MEYDILSRVQSLEGSISAQYLTRYWYVQYMYVHEFVYAWSTVPHPLLVCTVHGCICVCIYTLDNSQSDRLKSIFFKQVYMHVVVYTVV